MNQRNVDRQKRRITCEIQLSGQRHHGIVLDLSAKGLFIQTDATPPPGSPVQLVLRVGDQVIDLAARVARKRVVPRQLATVATGGLGVRLEDPPPEYLAVVKKERLGGRPERRRRERRKRRGERLRGERRKAERRDAGEEESAHCGLPTAPELSRQARRFRVRVQQSEGPRSRVLVVTASSPGEARTLALADLGSGWSILELEPTG